MCAWQIAKHLGMTVVAVIHQPRFEIFNMMDDVLLLAKGGRTVYLGDSHNAMPYFEVRYTRLQSRGVGH